LAPSNFIEDEVPAAGFPQINEMIYAYGDGPWWHRLRHPKVGPWWAWAWWPLFFWAGRREDGEKEFIEDEAPRAGLPPISQEFRLPPLGD